MNTSMPDAAPAMRDDEQVVVAWLRDHDATCPVCGYELRGHAKAVCSECGAPLKLGVVSDSVGIGAYLLAVIACACALGFDGVCAMLFAIMRGIIYFTNGASAAPEFFILFGTMLVLTVLSASALFMVARSRVRILRMPPWRRW